MSLTKGALHFAAPLPYIESFDRYLLIGPHPDDIEIGAGATAAKLAAMGKQVCFLICTDGRYGTEQAKEWKHLPDLMTDSKALSDPSVLADRKALADPEILTDPMALASIRKKEAEASSSLLGATDLRFLELSDGSFYSEEDLLRGIAQVIGDFQPDILFAPDPDVTSECHPDHLRVGKAAKALACFAPNPGIMAQYGTKAADVKAIALYMTAKPTRFVRTKAFFARQLEAIFTCHVSQFPPGSAAASSLRTYLKLRATDHGLRSFSTCAEGFRVLGTTHMHCLPEAGR